MTPCPWGMSLSWSKHSVLSLPSPGKHGGDGLGLVGSTSAQSAPVTVMVSSHPVFFPEVLMCHHHAMCSDGCLLTAGFERLSSHESQSCVFSSQCPFFHSDTDRTSQAGWLTVALRPHWLLTHLQRVLGNTLDEPNIYLLCSSTSILLENIACISAGW